MTTTMTWSQATHELRATLTADFYLVALAEIEEERKGKKMTATQERQAMNRARGMTVAKLYRMTEYNGVRNPIADDKEWGPNATKTTKPAAAPATDEAEVIAFLKKNSWSDFAKSLAAQYEDRGTLSPKQWASARKMKATMAAKEEAKKNTKPAINHTKPSSIDLTDLRSGYYSVPNGETRLKVRVSRPTKNSRWYGWTFVSDGAAYGQRTNYGKQAPSGKYQGDIQDQLRKIIANPKEAMEAYGKLTGTCGACGRHLEDEDSIRKGIGPICEQGW